MNKLELISKLRADGKGAALESICSRAAQMLEDAREVKIVVGEDGLPVGHFVNIVERRLSRHVRLGKRVAGLEESLNRIKTMTGNLKPAYAEADDALLQFWLGESDDLVGCVIGIKSES